MEALNKTNMNIPDELLRRENKKITSITIIDTIRNFRTLDIIKYRRIKIDIERLFEFRNENPDIPCYIRLDSIECPELEALFYNKIHCGTESNFMIDITLLIEYIKQINNEGFSVDKIMRKIDQYEFERKMSNINAELIIKEST